MTRCFIRDGCNFRCSPARVPPQALCSPGTASARYRGAIPSFHGQLSPERDQEMSLRRGSLASPDLHRGYSLLQPLCAPLPSHPTYPVTPTVRFHMYFSGASFPRFCFPSPILIPSFELFTASSSLIASLPFKPLMKTPKTTGPKTVPSISKSSSHHKMKVHIFEKFNIHVKREWKA